MAEPIAMAAPAPSFAALADIVGRSLLMLLMVFVGQGAWVRAAALLPIDSPTGALRLASDAGAFLFSVLVCVLAVIRPPAQARATSWNAKASALGAAFILTIVNRLPETPLPLAATLLAAVLLAIGNLGSAYCLSRLGGSFSVLPEARKLVVSGPYRVVRHPLYLAEAIATAGLVLLHWGVLAVAVGLAQTALQLYRLRQEEKLLAATFPDYADYAARTPRLIPRLLPTR